MSRSIRSSSLPLSRIRYSRRRVSSSAEAKLSHAREASLCAARTRLHLRLIPFGFGTVANARMYLAHSFPYLSLKYCQKFFAILDYPALDTICVFLLEQLPLLLPVSWHGRAGRLPA